MAHDMTITDTATVVYHSVRACEGRRVDQSASGIFKEYSKRTGDTLNFGKIYLMLTQLEHHGYIQSETREVLRNGQPKAIRWWFVTGKHPPATTATPSPHPQG